MGAWRAAAVLAGGLLSGCSSAPPPPALDTVPVAGEVVGRDGRPLAGGTVSFSPVETGGTGATADVRADGTFDLRTFHEGAVVAGAVPGDYRVWVSPPQGPDQRDVSFRLPKPVTVGRQENRFRIQQPPQ